MQSHEEFDPVPEEGLKDVGVITSVPDVSPDPKAPLYDQVTEYDRELYQRYCRAAGLSQPIKLTGPVIVSVVGLALIILKAYTGGIVLVALGPLTVLMNLGLERLRQRRRKKDAGPWWTGSWRIRLYTETVTRSGEEDGKEKEKETAYDDIRHLYEDDRYLFLQETSRNVYVIDKDKTEDWLTESVKMFMREPERKEEKGEKN